MSKQFKKEVYMHVLRNYIIIAIMICSSNIMLCGKKTTSISNYPTFNDKTSSKKYSLKVGDQEDARQKLLLHYQKTLRIVTNMQDKEIDDFTPDIQDFLKNIHAEETRTIHTIYQHMVEDILPKTSLNSKQLIAEQKLLFDKALDTSAIAKQALHKIIEEKHAEKSKWKHVLQQELNNMHNAQTSQQMRSDQQKLNKIKKDLLWQQEQLEQKHASKQKHLERHFKKEMSQITTLSKQPMQSWQPQLHTHITPSENLEQRKKRRTLFS